MHPHFNNGSKIWTALFPSLFAATVILTASVPARPQSAAPADDTVLFKNGDRLSGKLVEATHDEVTFAGTSTGTISLQWKTIQRINLYRSSLAVTSKASSSSSALNKFTVNLDAIEVHESDLVLTQSGAGPTMTVPIVDFVSLDPPGVRSGSILKGWRGMLQTQDSLTGATQKKYDVAGSLHVARPTQSKDAFSHQVTSVTLQADFGEASKPNASPVRTVLYQGILQQDVYLNDKGTAYLFGLSDFYHNLSLGMNSNNPTLWELVGTVITKNMDLALLAMFAMSVRTYMPPELHSSWLLAVSANTTHIHSRGRRRNRLVSTSESCSFLRLTNPAHIKQGVRPD